MDLFKKIVWKVGLGDFYAHHVMKRIPFEHRNVAEDWNTKEANIAHYASRIYMEVALLRRALADLHVEKSLEIGCGYGRLTPWIADYSEQHYAIEPEKMLLKDAEILNSGVVFRNAMVQKLPFQDDFFDLVVTWTVLMHVPPKEFARAVEEIKRVAKSSATILLTESTGVGHSSGV